MRGSCSDLVNWTIIVHSIYLGRGLSPNLIRRGSLPCWSTTCNLSWPLGPQARSASGGNLIPGYMCYAPFHLSAPRQAGIHAHTHVPFLLYCLHCLFLQKSPSYIIWLHYFIYSDIKGNLI